MTAAFDWSPGGCCCTPAGWFDVYDNRTFPPGQDAVRYTTLRPNVVVQPNTPSSDSVNGIGWYLPISQAVVPLYTAAGFPAFGTKWWSLETRGGVQYVIQYDSSGSSPTELLAFNQATFGSSFNQNMATIAWG